MSTPLTATKFQQALGEQLAIALGGHYHFFKSRLELRAEESLGANNVLILSGSNKYSPFVSISFYFGRSFAAARRLEKLIGEPQFHCHIQQYSPNRAHMKGLDYSGPFTWSANINDPSDSLVSEIVSAVHGIAEPFFERFSTIEAARDAISSNDSWCFGGRPFWSQVLILDAVMSDLPHFLHWSIVLDDVTRSQAMIQYDKLTAVIRNVA